jgi:phage shock protein C
MIAGVCCGLGESLGVDPTVVRLAFVAAAALGGASLLAYLILALVLPVDEPGSGAIKASRTRDALGLFLVAAGLVALAATLGWLRGVDRAVGWPLLLIALGAAVLLSRR